MRTGKIGHMTDLPESLVELARRYGVATEYDDWTGRHVTVAESTLVCTPSYAVHLAKVAAQGDRLDSLESVDKLLCTGEPGASEIAQRQRHVGHVAIIDPVGIDFAAAK